MSTVKSQLIRLMRYFFILSLLTMAIQPVNAQENENTGETNDFSTATILMVGGETVERLDLNNGTRDAVQQLHPPTQGLGLQADSEMGPQGVLDVDIHRSTNLLYIVHGPLPMGNATPYNMNIEQINLSTGSTNVIYEQRGAYNVVISPDGTKALVVFFEGEVGLHPRRVCVLTIANGQCQPVILNVSEEPLFWIDTQSFAVISVQRSLVRIDVATLASTTVLEAPEWFVHTFASIPDRRELLVAATRASSEPSGSPTTQLFVYGLDTESISQVQEFSIWSQPRSPVSYVDPYILRVSPDGRYFVYGGYSPLGLFELSTGRLIAEFNQVLNVTWFSDSSAVLLTQGGPDQPTEIVTVEPQTGLASIITTLNEFKFLVAP